MKMSLSTVFKKELSEDVAKVLRILYYPASKDLWIYHKDFFKIQNKLNRVMKQKKLEVGKKKKKPRKSPVAVVREEITQKSIS
jgi:hypothetical protein